MLRRWWTMRRRWRVMMWLILLAIAVLNAVVFFGIPGSSVASGSGRAAERTGDVGHLQVFRKRLNKSPNNSSGQNLMDSGPKGELPDDPFNDKHGEHHKYNDKEDNNFDNDQNPIVKWVMDIAKNQADNLEPVTLDKTAGQGHDKVTNEGQGYGKRKNYNLPEIDEFVWKFRAKYNSSLYSIGEDTKYDQFLKRLNDEKKRGLRLQSYVNNRGKRSWERFHHGIHQHYLYDPTDANLKKLLNDLATKSVIDIEQKEGGTQLKLMITFEDEGQALFKPMRFPRTQETLPDHFYFADYERHNAEIAAFHLDRSLGFHRVPPTTGRLMNISSEIFEFTNSKLAKTFFISPAGNWCFHGSCSYYCDSSHPICGHPIMLEGSLAAFLPPSQMAKRKTWRNPWKRSYSKHRKAYWEVYDDLCEKVQTKHPYNEGRRLLDILDMSVFDFLQGNLDRHHYETFRDFGNNTFLLHLDNGRAFGKSNYDCISCLAPVRQCCMIRLSTLAKLVKFYAGPDSLSHVMRQSLTSDPLNPILVEGHLDALDRRVSKIIHVIQGCLKNGKPWKDVIVDDDVT